MNPGPTPPLASLRWIQLAEPQGTCAGHCFQFRALESWVSGLWGTVVAVSKRNSRSPPPSVHDPALKRRRRRNCRGCTHACGAHAWRMAKRSRPEKRIVRGVGGLCFRVSVRSYLLRPGSSRPASPSEKAPVQKAVHEKNISNKRAAC